LMILQSLAIMGHLHGWGIALRIEQISEDVLFLKSGNDLSRAGTAGATRLDQVGMGRVGKQPESKVLLSESIGGMAEPPF
jgi:hypothetical protein